MADKPISRPSIGTPTQQDTFIRSAAKTLLSWRERRYTSQPSLTSYIIKIVCLADTHNSQPNLPRGDILLHAGDLSQYGTFDEIRNTLNWLNSQPHRWKVIIAGNHDLLLDKKFVAAFPDRGLGKPGKGYEDLQWGEVVYLQNSSATLEIESRRIKVFGSPLTPRLGKFAFQYGSEQGDIWCDTVPRDTDILLTHGPPMGHLGNNGKGCEWLLQELWRIKPKPRLMVFGHIHAGRGQRRVWFDDIEACYDNIIADKRPRANLFRMVWRVICVTVARTIAYGPTPSTIFTQLVNAAIVGGHDGRERGPIVIFI